MTNCKDCQRDFVKLLLMIIFLLWKNKKFQILNIFFYFAPLIWSLIKISKIPSDSPENFLLCNHCENIMPLLQTIIEIQHFPCLKIVKFCTLSKRSMKFPTSGKNYVDNKTICCGKPRKKCIKMLIIYPNFKIYFHKWCQFNLQEISFPIIYIFLYLIYVSTFNEDTKPCCLHVLIQKSGSTKITLSKILTPKYQIFRSHIYFLSHYC